MKKQWGVYDTVKPGEIHVIPVWEEDEHDFDTVCHCNPKIQIGIRMNRTAYYLIVHEAISE